MTKQSFDVLVMGAGPAGGQVASRCAEAGLSVALMESRGFGGVCPLRGCNPKKILLSSPEAVAMADNLQGKGLNAPPTVNWPDLAAFRDSFLEDLPARIREHYESAGCTTFQGKARLTGKDTVRVETEDGTHDLTGRHVVVAVGCTPRELEVPGAELADTSDDFLALNELPERILFIGGGFIALELAHISVRSGAKVSMINHSERILRGFDADMCEILLDATRHAGVDARMNLPVHSIVKTASGITVHFGEQGQTSVEADMVVNATGRVPDIADIGLELAGVEHDERGILVDDHMRSVSNPNVWSAGDVAATPFALTPTASIEADALADAIIHGRAEKPDYTGVPIVTYTTPPIASVGLSEEQARRDGIAHRVKQGDLAESFSWKRLGETHGGYKLLLDENADRILGAHMVGHNVEELVNLFAAAIRNRTSLKGLRSTVWAYPTCGYYLKYMLE